MTDGIRTVAVLGSSGTVGSLTGGLVAQSGIKVYFLSRTMEGADRGLEKAIGQARSEVIGRNVVCGDYDNLLEPALRKADWIIEALTEDKDIKSEMYQRLQTLLRSEAVVSSTTSSLPLALLVQGRSETFRRRFLATHFYNPPARMLACEIAGHRETEPRLVAHMNSFLAARLGREVVPVKNVAAFAGNRIAFLLFSRVASMVEEYGVELTDYLLGPYTGRVMAPLRTLDLIGLDIHRSIIRNLSEYTEDEMHELFVFPEYIENMIRCGALGNKTKHGFYKRLESGQYSFWDPQNSTYIAAIEPHIAFVEQAKQLVRLGMYDEAFQIIRQASSKNREARLVTNILCTYVGYAYHRVGEVTPSHFGIDGIDRVMAHGFHWAPPSVVLGLLGKEFVIAQLEEMGLEVPRALRNSLVVVRGRQLGIGKYFVAH